VEEQGTQDDKKTVASLRKQIDDLVKEAEKLAKMEDHVRRDHAINALKDKIDDLKDYVDELEKLSVYVGYILLER